MIPSYQEHWYPSFIINLSGVSTENHELKTKSNNCKNVCFSRNWIKMPQIRVFDNSVIISFNLPIKIYAVTPHKNCYTWQFSRWVKMFLGRHIKKYLSNIKYSNYLGQCIIQSQCVTFFWQPRFLPFFYKINPNLLQVNISKLVTFNNKVSPIKK